MKRKKGDDETRHSFHFIDGVRNGRTAMEYGNGEGAMGWPDEDENENGNGDGDGDGDESGQRESRAGARYLPHGGSQINLSSFAV